MRYAISEEGEKSLRLLSNNILLSCNSILESTQILSKVITDYSDTLGVYSEGIKEIVSNNATNLNANMEAIIELAVNINKKADDVVELVNMGLGDTCISNEISLSSANSNYNNQLAQSIMGAALVENVDFGELDSKTSEDIYKAIVETKKIFPDLNMKFVGSAQKRNELIAMDLYKMYMDAYKSHYPNASLDDLNIIVDEHVSEDMKFLNIDNDSIAQSLTVTNTNSHENNLISNYNGISINEQYGSNYEYFKSVREDNVKAGWKPVGCENPKATVDHELGHQIDKLVNANQDYVIRLMYDSFSRMDDHERRKVLSGYAGKKIQEFIAESWSEYRNNPNCRDYARIVSERMIALYNQRGLI